MTETRPTSEQLRFVSTQTGEHVLDVYLEASERGGRTLPDLLADLFTTSGQFNSSMIQFRVNPATSFLQVRAGVFTNANDGWLDIPDGRIFRQRGVYATGAAYERLDIVTQSNSTFVCTTAHTASAASPDSARFSTILDGTALNTATSSAQTSATNAAASAASAATSATTATNQATTATTQASNASASATAAANSASAAQTSATNAANSATTATNQATTATNQATAAQTSATNSANSASAAAASQTAAANSASAASTSATNAAASATSASNSATTATTRASEASASQTAAANSASAAATSATNAATSATTATNQAAAAGTSATNAAASATSASNSAASALASRDAAAASQTAAANSASAASTSATNAAASASAASTSAASAATNATAASGSASSASTSATNAANSATAAANSQSAAASSQSAAATSATSASNSATAAEAARVAAELALDSFDDRYLGAKASAPTLDNDGNALQTGALYWDTTLNVLRFWSGSAWTSIQPGLTEIDGDARYLRQTGGTLTGALAVISGTAAAPAIAPSGDSNTGIHFPAADTIAFVEGGVEVMRITADARVGIGTSTPAEPFHVAGSARFGASETQATGTAVIYADGDNITIEAHAGNDFQAKRALLLQTYGGNVGIGTSSPGNKLDIVSAGTSQIRVKDGVGATAYYDFGRDGTDGLFSFSGAQTTFSGYKWSVNAGTEAMRITNAGNVGIGTSSPGARLDVAGNILLSAAGATITFNSGGPTASVPAANTFAIGTSGTERFRIGPVGQLGIGGANYGSAGQVLMSNGASSAPSWQTISGGVTSFNSRTGAVSLASGDVTGALGYTPLSTGGGTVTGSVTIQNGDLQVGSSNNTASYIRMMDDESTNGRKSIHANSNVIGFLGGNDSWLMYVNTNAHIWTPGYGWLHDFFFHSINNCALNWAGNCGNNGNCYNGPGNCQPTVANCGNIAQIVHVLEDGGGGLNIRSYRYNFNCNCICDCNC